MNAHTIAQVANQATGLFIGITETADTYTVRDNRDGHEEVATRAEAVAIATEWATDAKDDAPAEDIAALDAFIAEVQA